MLLALLFVILITWKIGKLSFLRHHLLIGLLAFSALGAIITQLIFYATSPFNSGSSTILFYILPSGIPITGRLPVTIEEIREYGVLIALRVVLLILISALIPLTTHPGKFMLSLVKLRIPFFIIIITMGLRFISLVQTNFSQLKEAQMITGAFDDFFDYVYSDPWFNLIIKYLKYSFPVPFNKKEISTIKRFMTDEDGFEEYLQNRAMYEDAVINRGI